MDINWHQGLEVPDCSFAPDEQAMERFRQVDVLPWGALVSTHWDESMVPYRQQKLLLKQGELASADSNDGVANSTSTLKFVHDAHFFHDVA